MLDVDLVLPSRHLSSISSGTVPFSSYVWSWFTACNLKFVCFHPPPLNHIRLWVPWTIILRLMPKSTSVDFRAVFSFWLIWCSACWAFLSVAWTSESLAFSVHRTKIWIPASQESRLLLCRPTSIAPNTAYATFWRPSTRCSNISDKSFVFMSVQVVS